MTGVQTCALPISIVLGLILSTGLILLMKCIGYQDQDFNFDYRSLIIFIILGIVYFLYYKVFKKKMNTVLFIFLSAILGIIVCIL